MEPRRQGLGRDRGVRLRRPRVIHLLQCMSRLRARVQTIGGVPATGETLGSRWDEIDATKGVWGIPAEGRLVSRTYAPRAERNNMPHKGQWGLRRGYARKA